MSASPDSNKSHVSKDEKDDEKFMPKWVIVVLGIVIFVLWIGIPWLVSCGTTLPPNAGERGDAFGSVNALFTGLAFAGLIVTILIQGNELKLQREEIRMQREETARSNKLFKLQKEEMTRTANAQDEISKTQKETAEFMRQQVDSQRLTAEIQAFIQAKEVRQDRLRGLRKKESEEMPRLHQAEDGIRMHAASVKAGHYNEQSAKQAEIYHRTVVEVRKILEPILAEIEKEETTIKLMNSRLVKIADEFGSLHLVTRLREAPQKPSHQEPSTD
ncbi:hypothetical protein OPIT5_04100 [Opitutaceae bacterium TAV5]|nr:hypothetical protein OPIT5_04100 [Opitutaceae bacterium TAV5]